VARAFLDLQNEALANDFDAATYRASMKNWMNEAVGKIARRIHLPLLEAKYTLPVVAGTASYALPSDELVLTNLANLTDDYELEEHDPEWLDVQTTLSGKPTDFTQDGTSLVLYPTPNLAYAGLQARYLKTAAPLANDTDTLVALGIEDTYGAPILVSYARSKAFAQEDDGQMSDFWLGRAEKELAEYELYVQRRSRRRVRRIPGMYPRDDSSLPSPRRPG
jgi:hypothetical protein